MANPRERLLGDELVVHAHYDDRGSRTTVRPSGKRALDIRFAAAGNDARCKARRLSRGLQRPLRRVRGNQKPRAGHMEPFRVGIVNFYPVNAHDSASKLT
ncbi:hypothetical protein SDC9_69808 [bioreactor metagenome]|uniref:Uncharacterized protein n=1 Tax=bioreactor metagenome TaxID=1076179 RepID=A0A644Y557_9ZZZZ